MPKRWASNGTAVDPGRHGRVVADRHHPPRDRPPPAGGRQQLGALRLGLRHGCAGRDANTPVVSMASFYLLALAYNVILDFRRYLSPKKCNKGSRGKADVVMEVA